MSAKSIPTRDDFRCAVCQQKSAFHCEHDTPYRDQYLGTFDSRLPQNRLIFERRSKSETRNTNNSITNGGINKKQQVNSNAGAQQQQNKKLDRINVGAQHPQGNKSDKTHANASSKKNEQDPKSKSCVIL